VISSLSVHNPDGPDADHSEVDTEDEVAEAEARAEAARARLESLRDVAETGDTDDDAPDAEQPATSTRKRLRLLRRPRRPRWLRRPGRKTVAAGIGIVLFSTSVAGTGYMLWQHHTAVHNRQLAAEFSAAGRQGITAFMSIDPAHAKEDVQRSIDASTGDQKNQLAVLSPLIVRKAEETKVGNKVTIEGVAVESFSENSGVVLVAARTDPFGPDNGKPPPALFRLSVNIDRDGGQLKMSKVDFLR
jgi:Mce-associated membrane protein